MSHETSVSLNECLTTRSVERSKREIVLSCPDLKEVIHNALKSKALRNESDARVQVRERELEVAVTVVTCVLVCFGRCVCFNF